MENNLPSFYGVNYLTQIEKVKIKLDIKDNNEDPLIELLLDEAKETILDITNLDIIPLGLEGAQRDLAIIAYNKIGVEGETSHSEGGISRNYEDIPSSLMKKLKAFRILPRKKVQADA